VIKIGIFTTDFNIRQIALWRLINTGNDYNVKMYIFTYDSEISKPTIESYAKQFKGLEFEIIPAAKGKIRLPQNFLEKEKVNIAVLGYALD